jgi:hypothetical protein
MDNRKHSGKTPARQGAQTAAPEAFKISASTPYDFSARNLTAYGGLLPVATMLEKLGFEQLVEETLTITRPTRAMSVYRFVLAIVLALYVGFFAPESPALSGTRADADRESENRAVAAAMHLLAVSGLAASERGGGRFSGFSTSCGSAYGKARMWI